MIQKIKLKTGAVYTYSDAHKFITQTATDSTYVTAYDVTDKDYAEMGDDLPDDLADAVDEEVEYYKKLGVET
nr:MAG TPA: hypothetical protein [Bacteriophage sp.]